MGVLFTESFMRFARGQMSGYPANAPVFALNADTEYTIKGGTYSDTAMNLMSSGGRLTLAASTDGGNVFGIAADPVIASKNRLSLHLPQPTAGGYSSTLSIGRTFSSAKTHYMLGFLVRFNAGSVRTATPATTVSRASGFCFTIRNGIRTGSTTANLLSASPSVISNRLFIISDANAATWAAAGALTSTNGNTPPTFYINGTRDLNGTGKALAFDTDYFVEIEVDTVAQSIKYWIDDTYLGAGPWSPSFSDLANGFELWNIMYNSLTTDAGSATLSDIYCLDMSDGVTPNTRLGGSTRVLGEAPDTDVSVQFTPPAGFDSNHDVIDDPIASAAAPVNFLTGDGIGTKDIYRNANSVIGQLAGSVYAVTVRARYANASGSSHELAMVTKDATTETDNSLGTVAPGSGSRMSSVVLNRDPSGNAWTLSSAAALQYGFKIKS
jgi:hypothetical protein